MLGPGRGFCVALFSYLGEFCCAVVCMWDPDSFLVHSALLPTETWGKERTRVVLFVLGRFSFLDVLPHRIRMGSGPK